MSTPRQHRSVFLRNISRLFASTIVAASPILCLLLAPGCATPVTGPVSRYMQPAAPPPLTPPPGKSLVFIHRPLALNGLYLGVWDGTNFIADLANGHSVAHVCSPGRHVFSSRLISNVSVVEAHLLPDVCYDLSSLKTFKLVPIKSGDKERAFVAKWMQEARWVKPGPLAMDYQANRWTTTAELIEDFTTGSKHHRLLYLAPEDHR